MKSENLKKHYRNMFYEIGIKEEVINIRLQEIKQTFFYGSDDERLYFEYGEDMAYIVDTGNNDVRTEGMSYAMMICVQLNMKEEFDRLWKWAKTFMWLDSGENEGYFAWSCEEDCEFWKKATVASREYLAKACHPVTGFSAEYAEFDGSPMSRKLAWGHDRHDWFYSDAYRTAANIGLDYEWFGIDCGQRIAADRIQHYIAVVRKGEPYKIYEVDGSVIEQEALHPYGITATVAQASLAARDTQYSEWVQRFWKMPLRTGERRYYDNCLYFFAFLALSGNYRMW